MRISDWSSDVCSSDLVDVVHAQALQAGVAGLRHVLGRAVDAQEVAVGRAHVAELGGEHDLVATRGQHLGQQPLVLTDAVHVGGVERSDEHTSELQSLMRISYAVFCLKKKQSNMSISP